jgi:receptor protein-tyrosine kinase
MSKIFEAYKLKVGETVDVQTEVRRLGAVSLFNAPRGMQIDDFNRLTQRILSLRLDSRGSVISFASSASGEGSSFVSFNAASILAQAYNQKVAWIDGNFLSPQPKLIDSKQVSFSSLLQNPALIESIVVDQNPCLIGAGSNLMSAKGLLANRGYTELLGALSRRFDFVILDLPPVLDATDTALMAAGGDGLLLVIEQKFLKWEVVDYGIQVLREKGVHILGSVINRREFALPKIIYDRL